MNIIIGYMIGKMMGNLIVSILTLLIQAMRLLLIVAVKVLKYTFRGLRWIAGRLWEEGQGWYENYKLNLR